MVMNFFWELKFNCHHVIGSLIEMSAVMSAGSGENGCLTSNTAHLIQPDGSTKD